MTSATSSASVFNALGIDVEDLEWQQLALCRGAIPTDWFYEDYDNENISHMVDESCLSCPVMKQCLQQGIDNKEWGVWGAIYLVSGAKDDNKNKYKTPETWKRIHERLSEPADVEDEVSE